MAELGVTIGMVLALFRFAVALQAVALVGPEKSIILKSRV
jgi:hypothetical protein